MYCLDDIRERDKRGHRICPNRIMYAVYEGTTERQVKQDMQAQDSNSDAITDGIQLACAILEIGIFCIECA